MKATLEIQLSEMLTAAELAGLAARAAVERRPIEALIVEAIRNLLGRRGDGRDGPDGPDGRDGRGGAAMAA